MRASRSLDCHQQCTWLLRRVVAVVLLCALVDRGERLSSVSVVVSVRFRRVSQLEFGRCLDSVSRSTLGLWHGGVAGFMVSEGTLVCSRRCHGLEWCQGALCGAVRPCGSGAAGVCL